MLAKAMRLRCAGYGEKSTIADGLKGAAWILGSAVADHESKGPPIGEERHPVRVSAGLPRKPEHDDHCHGQRAGSHELAFFAFS